MHARLGAALLSCDIALDARPYAPHATLARKAQCAKRPPVRPTLAWRADSFALAKSRRGQSYRLLATFATEEPTPRR